MPALWFVPMNPLPCDYSERADAVRVILRSTQLPKDEVFELMNDWAPEIDDEELEQMWAQREVVQ